MCYVLRRRMLHETEEGTKQSAGGAGPVRAGLVLVHSGLTPIFRPFAFAEDGSPFLSGRAGPAGPVAADRRLSREHAEIAWGRGGFRVRDLSSRNGTFVDGVRVEGEVVVPSLRVIRTGETVFVPCGNVGAVAFPADPGGPIVGTQLFAANVDVDRAASGSDTLLILGESGTGKELAARRFHQRGPNARGPFVAVNCAAIPAGLAERLLFGAKRGAYSGSVVDSIGHLQAADGGVLFLDEIGELDLQVQAKLLRVLETREVVPLGASHGARVETRICAATHENLRAAVAERRFRGDLYHRLAPPEVVLPPLRERLDEIPQHVVAAIAAAAPGLTPQAELIEACLLRQWPGNVRELRKQIHDAALKASIALDDRVRLEHLAPNAGSALARRTSEPSAKEPESPREAGPKEYVKWSKSITRELLERTMIEHSWNASASARALGMPRSQIYREMSRLSLKMPKGRSDGEK
jgi:transcriptional regulator of acetoin/glycerol metabolism